MVVLDTTGSGYAAVVEQAGGRPVYVHRLVAVAHDVLDGLDDPRHVHHTVHPWVNSAAALEAVDAADHDGTDHAPARA